MIPSKPAFANGRLPPMQLRRGSVGPSVALHLHASYLLRGLVFLTARTPDTAAMQVAAVHPAPPLRTAAILCGPAPRR